MLALLLLFEDISALPRPLSPSLSLLSALLRRDIFVPLESVFVKM